MSEAMAAAHGWQRVHEELVRIARARAELDWEEGRCLVRAYRARVHVALGFGHFAEYAERHLGYKPRWTSEKLRVAEALETLPAIGDALRRGAICWSAVRELTRIATSETESDWMQAVRGRTVRDIEGMVSGHKAGDRPTDPADPLARRHTLRFEVSAETLAMFRNATQKLREDSGGGLDDDALLLTMAQRILGQPRDDGRSNYRLAMTLCPECHRGTIEAGGESIAAAPAFVATAQCDAELVPIPAPRSGPAALEVPSASPASDERKADSTHVGTAEGDGEGTSPKPLHRATQTVPPRVRRFVRCRDRHCIVPGCRNSFCDVHHVKPRHEGGGHDPDSLCLLCKAHHRAVHRGTLLLEGNFSEGFRFLHADGSAYGSPSSPRTADRATRTFQALRHMGFRHGEARRAVDAVRASPAHTEPIEQWIRQALALLTTPAKAA